MSDARRRSAPDAQYRAPEAEEILRRVWGERGGSPATLTEHVHRLRRKLESGGVEITTVRGLGYCLQKVRAA